MGQVIRLPNASAKPRPDPVVRDALMRMNYLLAGSLRPGRDDAHATLMAIADILEASDLCEAVGIDRPKAG